MSNPADPAVTVEVALTDDAMTVRLEIRCQGATRMVEKELLFQESVSADQRAERLAKYLGWAIKEFVSREYQLSCMKAAFRKEIFP